MIGKNDKVETIEDPKDICPKCGTMMTIEDDQYVCPHCDGEIDYFGDEEDEF